MEQQEMNLDQEAVKEAVNETPEAVAEAMAAEQKFNDFKAKVDDLTKEFGVKLVGAMAFENVGGFGTIISGDLNDLETEGLKRLLDKRS